MKKTAIIYLSKTGFTKKYAQWTAEESGADIIPFSEAKKRRDKILTEYDSVVFGSRLIGGTINGLSKAKKLFYTGKIPFAVFVTGATPIDAQDTAPTLKKMWEQNFTPAELDSIPHFYMQSGLSYENMPFIEKQMMNAFKSMLKKKKGAEGISEGMAEVLGSSFDNSDKKFAAPLIQWIKG